MHMAAFLAAVISGNVIAADSVNVSVTGNIVASPAYLMGETPIWMLISAIFRRQIWLRRDRFPIRLPLICCSLFARWAPAV
jgi:hypothetical protein